MQGDFDASVALSFATEQARRSCDWSEGYRMVLTQARELCAQVETRETADAQNVPYSPQDSAAAMLPMKWHKFLIYFALLAARSSTASMACTPSPTVLAASTLLSTKCSPRH